jgi:hypothetical protein
LLKRDDVERRSVGLPPAVRAKLLDDWDMMAEAAKMYRQRCEELQAGAKVERRPLRAVAERDVVGTEPVLYSVRMISLVLGRTESRVRQMLRAGELEGVKVHERWMITEDSVGDYGMRQLMARQTA